MLQRTASAGYKSISRMRGCLGAATASTVVRTALLLHFTAAAVAAANPEATSRLP